MTSGFANSITIHENASSVGPSYSLLTSMAVIIRHCMIQALVMDGVKPTMAANSTSAGMPRSAVSQRRLKQTVFTSVKRIATCRPDTAMMCEIPDCLNAVFIS